MHDVHWSTVVSQLLFDVFINDVKERASSTLIKLANDSKPKGVADARAGREIIQRNLRQLKNEKP